MVWGRLWRGGNCGAEATGTGVVAAVAWIQQQFCFGFVENNRNFIRGFGSYAQEAMIALHRRDIANYLMMVIK